MTNYDQLLTSVEILSNTRDIRQMYDITSTNQQLITLIFFTNFLFFFCLPKSWPEGEK